MLRKVISQMTIALLLSIKVTAWSQSTGEKTLQPGAVTDVADQVAQYRAILDQPPEKLAILGREHAVRLLAELKHGRAIAKGESREKNLEHTRVELMARFDEAKKQYTDLRGQVEAEMEKIRQQFNDNPPECDRQLLALVNRHRPRVLHLKDEAAQCKQLADATDSRLAEVRRELVTVNREKELLAQGHKFARPVTPHGLVELGLSKETLASFGLDEKTTSELGLGAGELGLEGISPDVSTSVSTPVRPVSRESVQQAVDEFKKLF